MIRNAILIFGSFVVVFSSCRRENHQLLILKNLSSENIYFLFSEYNTLTDPNEVYRIRPISSGPMSEVRVEYADKELERVTRENLYRYRIEKNGTGTLLTSEAVGIYLDANSIKEIIEDRYKGELNIFIITESYLQNNSDEEIISNKMYEHFKTVTSEDIKGDSLVLEYL